MVRVQYRPLPQSAAFLTGEMYFPPDTSFRFAMSAHLPFTLTIELQASAVYEGVAHADYLHEFASPESQHTLGELNAFLSPYLQ